MFGDAAKADDDDDEHAHGHQHSDIGAHYQLTCANPDKLATVRPDAPVQGLPGHPENQRATDRPQRPERRGSHAAKAAVAF
nr:DUF2796 domain-containing protein [Pseudomonas peli]